MPQKNRMNDSTEDWSLFAWKTLLPNAKVLDYAFGLAIATYYIYYVLLLYSDSLKKSGRIKFTVIFIYL